MLLANTEERAIGLIANAIQSFWHSHQEASSAILGSKGRKVAKGDAPWVFRDWTTVG